MEVWFPKVMIGAQPNCSNSQPFGYALDFNELKFLNLKLLPKSFQSITNNYAGFCKDALKPLIENLIK